MYYAMQPTLVRFSAERERESSPCQHFYLPLYILVALLNSVLPRTHDSLYTLNHAIQANFFRCFPLNFNFL